MQGGAESAIPICEYTGRENRRPGVSWHHRHLHRCVRPSRGREIRQRVNKIAVEIVYALSDRQVLPRILLPDGSTVEDAIRLSGLRAVFPEMDTTRVGIHGEPVSVDTILRDRDRVEIYRPLQVDPK